MKKGSIFKFFSRAQPASEAGAAGGGGPEAGAAGGGGSGDATGSTVSEDPAADVDDAPPEEGEGSAKKQKLTGRPSRTRVLNKEFIETAHPSVQEVSFVDKTDPYLTHAKAYNQKYVCICQVLVSDKGWLSKQLALREITHSDDAHNKRHQHTADVTPSPDPLNQQKSTYHEKSSQFAVEPARQWKDNKFVRGDVFPGFFTGTWTTTLTQGDLALVLIILYFQDRLGLEALLYITGYFIIVSVLSTSLAVAKIMINFVLPMSMASKLIQLRALWTSRDASSVSPTTWFIAFYSCVARIFTTIVETGDIPVLLTQSVSGVLNCSIGLSVVYLQAQKTFAKREKRA
ncbi:PQ-loop repeat-containing protein 3 [Branchiostoma belcheri]|nr:PQ-loop repeat-containing protein 3 [Branchiostoma belcheri]